VRLWILRLHSGIAAVQQIDSKVIGIWQERVMDVKQQQLLVVE
jgi:hypothetical protein